jgi:hypothetical protein
MGYIVAVGELIDNALDFFATEITVDFQGTTFEVWDNGTGVSFEGFEALYTLGGHLPTDRRATGGRRRGRIGRHGRGAKDALGWLWGVATITSAQEGIKRRLVIDWNREASKGLISDSALPPVQVLRGPAGERTFTRISVRGHIRNEISFELFTRMIDEYGHIYRPSLLEGVRLRLRRRKDVVEVLPMEEPTRRLDCPMVDTTITVAGRPVHVRAYVTQDIPRFGGLHIAVAGRVMDHIRTSVHVRNVYGWVTLGDEWDVATDKTAITDIYRAELDRAVETACHPVLAAAEQITRRLVIEELQVAVSELLRDVFRQTGIRPGVMVNHTSPRHEGTGENERAAPGPEPSGRLPSANIPMTENPDEQWEDENWSNPPGIRYDFQRLTSGELAELRVEPSEWVVVIDLEHPVVKGYLEERVLGAAGRQGIDDTRTVMLLAHVIAAASATNDAVADAMPFLAGYAPSQRYGIAAAHLIRTLLARRRPSK